MALPSETLESLATQARQFFTQSIPGAIANVWANTFTITAKVLALIGFEIQLRRAALFRQLFASTADPPWLYRHGFELGLGPPAAATPAIGTITVACTAGLAIPAGLQYERPDGATYSLRLTTTPGGSSATLSLQADIAGAAGNCDAGTTLTLVPSHAAPAGLGTSAPVNAQADGGGCEGGVDAETTEHYRQRVLRRKQQPPTGGSAPDYAAWVEDALPTVIAGSVIVDSFVDDTRWVWITFLVSDQANGIPSSGEIAAVQAYVADPIRRPVTARVHVAAPTTVDVPITIAGLNPDTPDTRAAVIAELQAVQAEQIAPATPSTEFVLFYQWLDAAIARADGVVSATLTAPSGNLTYSTAGEMPVLGMPSFV
jgi:uncharacterized phage protein gp47/JayE